MDVTSFNSSELGFEPGLVVLIGQFSPRQVTDTRYAISISVDINGCRLMKATMGRNSRLTKRINPVATAA
jgi:hypothetical protein